MSVSYFSDFAYIGCVSINETSFSNVTTENFNSPEVCSIFCYDAGAPYMAVQAQYCACATSVEILITYANADNGECYFSCDDPTSNLYCGGVDANTYAPIYNLYGPPIVSSSVSISVPLSTSTSTAPDFSSFGTITIDFPSSSSTPADSPGTTTYYYTLPSSADSISYSTSNITFVPATSISSVLIVYESTSTSTLSFLIPTSTSSIVFQTSTASIVVPTSTLSTVVPTIPAGSSSDSVSSQTFITSAVGATSTSAATTPATSITTFVGSSLGSNSSYVSPTSTVVSAMTTSATGVPIITRTLYSTSLITITSCAPTVTNCPLRSSSTVVAIGTTCYPAQAFTSVIQPTPSNSAPVSSVIYYDTACSSVSTSYSTITLSCSSSTAVTVSPYECLVPVTSYEQPAPVSSYADQAPVSSNTHPVPVATAGPSSAAASVTTTGFPAPTATAGAQPHAMVAKALAVVAACGVIAAVAGG